MNDFTALNSSQLYKLVYAVAEASINSNGAIRGIGFSLWDQVQISPDSPGADKATIVGECVRARACACACARARVRARVRVRV